MSEHGEVSVNHSLTTHSLCLNTHDIYKTRCAYLVGDVVHNQRSCRLAVVHGRQAVISLLARCATLSSRTEHERVSLTATSMMFFNIPVSHISNFTSWESTATHFARNAAASQLAPFRATVAHRPAV